MQTFDDVEKAELDREDNRPFHFFSLFLSYFEREACNDAENDERVWTRYI